MTRKYMVAVAVTDNKNGKPLDEAIVLMECQAKSERAARAKASATALGLWTHATLEIKAVSRLKENGSPVTMGIISLAQRASELYICPDGPVKPGTEIEVRDVADDHVIGRTAIKEIKATVKPKNGNQSSAYALIMGTMEDGDDDKGKALVKHRGKRACPINSDMMGAIAEKGTLIDYRSK